MKTLLFIISLSLCFAVLCVCSFLGVSMESAIWRALVVFVATYTVGLAAALIIFISYFSGKRKKVFQNVPTAELQSVNQQISETTEEKKTE